MKLEATYCINLDHRTDRWESVQNEFKKIGVNNVKRFNAIQNIQGHIGCMLSHLGVLEICKDFKQFMVTEDDIRFINNPVHTLSMAEQQLPKHWDALYLGCNPQESLVRHSHNLFYLKNAYCAHAIIFNSKELVKYILDNKTTVIEEQRIDVFYAKHIQDKFKCFAVAPMVATQETLYSDITRKVNDNHKIIANNFEKATT